MRTCSFAVYKKWLPAWHSTVHQLPTWILITPPFCLPACHFSLSISNITCLSSPGASLLLSPLLSSFHQITSTAIRDVSFNHASSSAYFFTLYLLCSHLSPHISSSQSPVSSKCSGLLRSCDVSVCFNGKPLFLLRSMFPFTRLTHLSSSPHLSHPPCVLFCLFFCLFTVVQYSTCPRHLSFSFSNTLENFFLSLFLTWDECISPSVRICQ